MEQKSPQINYLNFVGNVIIFTSKRKDTLNLLIKTLAIYENTFGLLINKNKSHFIVPSNAFLAIIKRNKIMIGFLQK